MMDLGQMKGDGAWIAAGRAAIISNSRVQHQDIPGGRKQEESRGRLRKWLLVLLHLNAV